MIVMLKNSNIPTLFLKLNLIVFMVTDFLLSVKDSFEDHARPSGIGQVVLFQSSCGTSWILKNSRNAFERSPVGR